MNDGFRNLKNALRAASDAADGTAPDFERLFAGAERQVLRSRRVRYSGLAAAAVTAILVLSQQLITDRQFTYVNVDELVATTSWSAPSDTLLPQYQINLYRDLPELFGSTDIDEGALL